MDIRKALFRVVSGCVLSCLIFAMQGCAKSSGYEVRLDAIRTTEKLDDRISVSVWLYDSAGEKLQNLFVQGAKLGEGPVREWISLDSTRFIAIPDETVDQNGVVSFVIKLNPNRLAIPPDAVFYAQVRPSEVFTEGGAERADPKTFIVEAAAKRPFELRFELRAPLKTASR